MLGKLTSGSQDNDRWSTTVGCTSGVVLLAGEALDDGKDKGEGFTATGASSADEIVALNDGVEAACLDGKEGFDAFGTDE